ncbi:MAG: hypothetical protein ABIK65_12770 [Candidatus Eisenbacteria bacterium]
MPRPFLRLLGPALVLLFSSTALPRTWVVRPDGTGDAPTIAAAIDSVNSGDDVIELMDGTFTGEGNRDLTNGEKTIVIRSASGNPAACVIDCEGSETDPHEFIAFWGGG